MPPKAAAPKAIPNILVHEDVFNRGKKYADAKIAPSASKGDLRQEDLSIPPHFHSLPEFKPLKWYKQGKCLLEGDDESIEPPKLGHSLSDPCLHPRARKEVLDVCKGLKAQSKNAEKRKVMFEKQNSKISAKVEKRDVLVEKIKEMDLSMNDELRECRRYVAEVRLFDPVYMYESKFGKKAPRKDVLLVAEKCDAIAAYFNEVLDELKKFMEQVVVNCATFNICTFNTTVEPFHTTFVSPEDAKKGMPQAVKWLVKNYNGKTMAELPSANWKVMFEKVFEMGEPSAIYLACFNAPEQVDEIHQFLDGKGVPVHCVCFDADITDEQKIFFKELSGESGTLAVDTSQRDMQMCDEMMQSVKSKKKQLEKLEKQLEKMEDLKPQLEEGETLLAEQDAILQFITNDIEICETAIAGEDLARDEEGNLILPKDPEEITITDAIPEEVEEVDEKVPENDVVDTPS